MTIARALWLTLLLGFAREAAAEQWFVQVGGSQFAFSPAELTIAPGDTVTFRNLGGVHNVVADDGAFRCAYGCDGNGGNGGASGEIWLFTLTFTEPGRYGYFCEPHGAPGSGMHGSITVSAPPPPPLPPSDAVPIGGGLWSLLLVVAFLAGARALRKA